MAQENQEGKDDFQLDQERQRMGVDFLALNLRYTNPDPEEDGELDFDATGAGTDPDEAYNTFGVSFLFPWWPPARFVCSPVPVFGTDRRTPRWYPTLGEVAMQP